MSGETMPNPVDAGEDFARIILKACAYDPEERYQTPEELHEELENLKYGRTTAGRHIEKKERRKVDSAVDQIIHPKKNVQTSAPIRQSAPARQKRRRRPFPWTVAVFAIALAVCLMIGLYFRLILIKERQKARELIQLLEENDYSTAQIDDFSIAIQNIKDHATTITNNLGIYKQIGKKDEIYRYYDEDGNLMKALIYPAESDDGVYEEYFYWDEELFFAYIWSDEDDANLYYFNNGKMIRWIDEAGKVHDGETENPEYVERAEKYWENAVFRQSEQSEE
jgi:serine/threonine-protein kinase